MLKKTAEKQNFNNFLDQELKFSDQELYTKPRLIDSEFICDQLNELKSGQGSLYELRQALSSCEYEYQYSSYHNVSEASAKSLDLKRTTKNSSSSNDYN